MKSPNIAYNPRIDQLRWLAATIVFLYHFNLEFGLRTGVHLSDPWWGIVTEGHTGVGLFFTLSGFLFMQIAFEQQRIVYREFVRNRVLRIFPLFLTIFLLATSISRDRYRAQDILYLFASNIGLSPTSDTVVTGAAWTISLEFTFYLMFPFLARFTLERGARYLFGLLALMLVMKVAAYSVSGEKTTLMYFSTFVGRFDQFLIGMLAALGYRAWGERLRRAAWALVPLAFALAVANSALQARVAPFNPASRNEFWIIWSLLESSVWSFVILAWLSLQRPMPGWLERTLCQGGKISFSFYLLHMAVLHVLARGVDRTGIDTHGVIAAAILLALAYALTWAIATLSYRTIEEPFLRMRHRYGLAHGASDRPSEQRAGEFVAGTSSVRTDREPPPAQRAVARAEPAEEPVVSADRHT